MAMAHDHVNHVNHVNVCEDKVLSQTLLSEQMVRVLIQK